MLYYAAITLTILSSMVYHTLLKLTPSGAHPALSLAVTYAIAAVVCVGMLLLMPLRTGVADALRQLNWVSYVLGLALVGLEMGFLLSYRSGWRVGIAGVVVTVTVAILLIPVGLVLFKDKPSLLNVAGVLVAVVGLVMMNAK
jgi:multidrug transporter EmrE-like cation transporter